ncbi:hypothetical protein N7492_010407 [Penicillium capsulatum]|uniref:Zn(2)-C6 fungal-type domain-containing protein n=1 Tax=Penicillium capsulatum TaxID=69766 RepID=A0A9W9HP59_9EURO|nr:hypothetical protein N7492_010407 [Penicillium capsulatum]KAJ6112911.1 hypothetical protein N7512_008235 [Penicillium capsulatum]
MDLSGQKFVRARRTHRKSRSGSLSCFPGRSWRRLDSSKNNSNDQLQCDEKRPVCSNCSNHDIECSFSTVENVHSESSETGISAMTPESRPQPRRYQPYQYSTGGLKQIFRLNKTTNPSQASPESNHEIKDASSDAGPPDTISLADLHLFHHYTISTYRSMTAAEDPKRVWQDHLVQWGIEFPSILHLILALSALHLSYERLAQREHYIHQADNHFTFGVRSVTNVLSQLNEDNCQKIYMAASLICFIYFGRGPRPGEYLIFSDSGPAEWLVLMHGVRVVVATYHEKVFSGILKPEPEERDRTLSPAMRSELQEHTTRMDAVQRLVEQEILNDNNQSAYISAIKDLVGIMDEVYERRTAGTPGVGIMHLVVGWLYRRPETFVAFLERKEPRALIILAYWGVFLKYMESSWFMGGWGEHVLSGIARNLEPDFQSWIDWPLQRVGVSR